VEVFLIVLSGVVLVCLIVVLFLAQYFLRVITNLFLGITMKSPPENGEDAQGATVTFNSLDGLQLEGLWLAARADGEPRGTIIFSHEFGSNYNSAVKYAGFLVDAGYNLFAFNYRGEGRGPNGVRYEPRHWTSDREISDIRGAIAYVKRRPEYDGSGLGLMGISRGATASVYASAGDDDVKAVVSDSAFSTRKTLDYYMRKWAVIFAFVPAIYTRIPTFAYNFLGRTALWISERRLKVRMPHLEDALPRTKSPIFFIHGKNDPNIDYRQAVYLHDLAAGPKKLWIVCDAKHNESVVVAPDEYQQHVTSFFDRYLATRHVSTTAGAETAET